MRLTFVIPVVVASSSPVSSATMEQAADAAGQLAGSYNRALFLCKAASIPMPEMLTLNPEMTKTALDMYNRYPDYYKHGSEKGYAQAERMLEDKRDVPEQCAV